LETYLHPQDGRSCVDSKPHHLPGFKVSSNQLKLKVCSMMFPSCNLIWNLGKWSMREKLKHLKHHFQFLRENKIKNLKVHSGDLQGSTRSHRFQQPRPLTILQVNQDPRSLMYGTTLKPNWKTSFLTMWPMRPSKNGRH
jgi:hypothetical protein